MPLVRHYWAALHDAIQGKIDWLANGDETQVSLEPVPTKCLDNKGANKVIVKINTRAKKQRYSVLPLCDQNFFGDS